MVGGVEGYVVFFSLNGQLWLSVRMLMGELLSHIGVIAYLVL